MDYGFYFRHSLWDSETWAAATDDEHPVNGEFFEAAIFTFTAEEGTEITVTGQLRAESAQGIEAGEVLLRISSWGEEFYIRFDEYMDHVKKYDNFLFSSILYIRRRG